jgi:MFS family permease
MFVGVGVGYYGLAVFLRPLQEENGWSNAVVSGATGAYFSIAGVTAALAGPQIDRRGPLKFMLVGVVMMGAAVSAVGYLTTVWQLYLTYTFLAIAFGLGTGTGVQSILNRWFVTRRAQAMSIAFTGVSVGGMVLVPLGTYLIGRGGLRLAAPMMGALVLIIGLPMVLAVLVWDPKQIDSQVDFDRPLEIKNQLLDESVQMRTWTRREAATTAAFWSILLSFFLVLAAQTGFLLHQLSFLEDRFGSGQIASLTLTVTAFGSIIARLVVGQFADRLAKRTLSVALFVIQAICVLGVAFIDNAVTTWIFVLIIGFTIGNIYMMQALLVSEIFGFASFATVMGLISVATQAGSGLGPFSVGWLEQQTGSYTLPFAVTATVTLVAATLLVLAKPPAASAATASPGRSLTNTCSRT